MVLGDNFGISAHFFLSRGFDTFFKDVCNAAPLQGLDLLMFYSNKIKVFSSP